MAKPISKTLIGAFVLGALALVFGGIVILGSGALFRDIKEVVMFFDGSVGGLQVGAPVTFRGVAVGEVSRIQIVYRADRKEFLIPVAARLYPDRFQKVSESYKKMEAQELMDMGLRAQLQLQSFITGQLSIQLDFFPGSELRLIGPTMAGFSAHVQEIPTIPTPMQKIEQSIQQIPLDEVIRDARDTLASIRDILTSPAIPDIIANLKQVSQDAVGLTQSAEARLAAMSSQVDLTLRELRTLAANANTQLRPVGPAVDETRTLLQNINRQIEPLAAEVSSTAAEFRAALKQSEATLANLSSMTAENAGLRYNLEQFLTELAATARSLRTLSDYLDRHPDSLLRGKTSDPPMGGRP
jgi:paraquat-inducible protein B